MPNLLKSLPREILEKEDSKFIYNVLNPLLFDKIKETEEDTTVTHKVSSLLNKDINLKGQFLPEFILPYNINSREFHAYMTDGQENLKLEYFGKTELIEELDDLKDFIFFHFGVDGYGFLYDIVKKFYYIKNEYETNKKLYEYNYKKYLDAVEVRKKKVYKSTYEHFKKLFDEFANLKTEFNMVFLESGKHNDYSINQLVDNYAREISNHLGIKTFDNDIIFENSELFSLLTDSIIFDSEVTKHVFSGKNIVKTTKYPVNNVFELIAVFAMEISTLISKYDEYLELLMNNDNGYALDRSEHKKLKNEKYNAINLDLESDNVTYFLNEEKNELEIYTYFLRDFRIDEGTITLTINDREIPPSIQSLSGENNYGYTIFEYFDDETKYYKIIIHDYLIYDIEDEYVNFDVESLNIQFDAIRAVYQQPESPQELNLESTGFLDNFVIYKKNETTGFFEVMNVPYKVKVSIDEKEERYSRSYEFVGIDNGAHHELISQSEIIIGCYDFDYVYEPKIYVDFFKYLKSEVVFRYNTILPYVLIDDILGEELEISYYSEIPINEYSTNIHKNITMYDGKTYKKIFDEIDNMRLINPYNESDYNFVSKISYSLYKERNHTNPLLIDGMVNKIPFRGNLRLLNKLQFDEERNMIVFMYQGVQCALPLEEGLERGLNHENLRYNFQQQKLYYHDVDLCDGGFKYTDTGIYLKNPITDDYDLIEITPTEQINLSVRDKEIFFDMFEMCHCVILDSKKYKVGGLYIDTYDNAMKSSQVMFVESKYGIPRYKSSDGEIIDVDFSRTILDGESPSDGAIIYDRADNELVFRKTITETYTMQLIKLDQKINKHRQVGMNASSIFYAGNVLPENSNKTFFGRENIYGSMFMPDDIYNIGKSGDVYNGLQEHNLLAEQMDLNAEDASKYNMEQEPYIMFKSATASLKGLESYIRSSLKSISQDIGVSPVYLVQRNRFISEWARVSTVLPQSDFAESALKELVADLMETKLLNHNYDDLMDIFKNNEYEKFSIDTNDIHGILVHYLLRFMGDENMLEEYTYYLIHEVWIKKNRKKVIDFVVEHANEKVVREISEMTFESDFEKETLFYRFLEEIGKIKKATISSYIPIANYSDWNLYQENNHIQFDKQYRYEVLDISEFITMPIEWEQPLLMIRPLNEDGVFTKRDYRFLDLSMVTHSELTYADAYNEYVEDIKNKLNMSVDYLNETLSMLSELAVTEGFDFLRVNLVVVKWIVERYLSTYMASNKLEDVETFREIIKQEILNADHPNLIVSYNKIKETTLLGDLGSNVSEIYESITAGNLVANNTVRLNITSSEELAYLDKVKKPLEHYFDYLFFCKRHDLITKVLALFTEDVIATSMLDLSFAINIKNSKGDETFDIYEQMIYEIFDEFLPFHTVLDKIIFTIKVMEAQSGEAVSKQLDALVEDTHMIDIMMDFVEKIRIQALDRVDIIRLNARIPSSGLVLCGAHDVIPYDYDRSIRPGGHDIPRHSDDYEHYGVDDEWYVVNKQEWRTRTNDVYHPPRFAEHWWDCESIGDVEQVADTWLSEYYHIKTDIFERDDIIESHFVDSIPVIGITHDNSEIPDIDVTEDYLIRVDSTYKIKFYDMDTIGHDDYGLDEAWGPDDQTTLIGMKDDMRQDILQDFYDKLNVSVLDSIWSDVIVVYDLIDIPGHDEFAVDEYYHQRSPERIEQEISTMVYDELLATGFGLKVVDMSDVSMVDEILATSVMNDYKDMILDTVVSDGLHVTVDIITNRHFDSEGHFLRPAHGEFVYDEYYHDSADPDRADNTAAVGVYEFMGDVRIDFGFMRMLPFDPYEEMIRQKFYRADQPGSESQISRIRDKFTSHVQMFSKDIIRVSLMDFYALDLIAEDTRRIVYEGIETDAFGGDVFTSSIADSLIKRNIHHDFRENIIAIDKYASILSDEDILEIYGTRAANVERDELFKIEFGDTIYSTIKVKESVERSLTTFDRDYLKSIKVEEENFVEFKYLERRIKVRFDDALRTYLAFNDRSTLLLTETNRETIEQFTKEETVSVGLLDRVHYGRRTTFEIDGMLLSASDSLIQAWSNKLHQDSMIISVTDTTDLKTSINLDYDFGDERTTQLHDEYGQMGYTEESVDRSIDSRLTDSLVQISDETYFDKPMTEMYDYMMHDVQHYFGDYIDVVISDSLHTYVNIVKKPWIWPEFDEFGHNEYPHMYSGDSDEFDVSTQLRDNIRFDAYTKLYDAGALVGFYENIHVGHHYDMGKDNISVSMTDDLKVIDILTPGKDTLSVDSSDFIPLDYSHKDQKVNIIVADRMWYGYKMHDETANIEVSEKIFYDFEDSDAMMIDKVPAKIRDWLVIDYTFIDDRPSIVLGDKLKSVDIATGTVGSHIPKDIAPVALNDSLNVHEFRDISLFDTQAKVYISDKLITGSETGEKHEEETDVDLIMKDTVGVATFEQPLEYGPGKWFREQTFVWPDNRLYITDYPTAPEPMVIDTQLEDSFHHVVKLAPFKDSLAIDTYERMKFGPVFRDKANVNFTNEALDVRLLFLNDRYGIDIMPHDFNDMEYFNDAADRAFTALAKDDIKVLDTHLTFNESFTILSSDQLNLQPGDDTKVVATALRTDIAPITFTESLDIRLSFTNDRYGVDGNFADEQEASIGTFSTFGVNNLNNEPEIDEDFLVGHDDLQQEYANDSGDRAFDVITNDGISNVDVEFFFKDTLKVEDIIDRMATSKDDKAMEINTGKDTGLVSITERLDVGLSWTDDRFGVDEAPHAEDQMEYYNDSADRSFEVSSYDGIVTVDTNTLSSDYLEVETIDRLVTHAAPILDESTTTKDGIVVTGNDNLMYGIGQYDYVWDAKEWEQFGYEVPYENWKGPIPHDATPHDELEHGQQGDDVSQITTGVTDKLIFGLDYIFKEELKVKTEDRVSYAMLIERPDFKDDDLNVLFTDRVFINNNHRDFQSKIMVGGQDSLTSYAEIAPIEEGIKLRDVLNVGLIDNMSFKPAFRNFAGVIFSNEKIESSNVQSDWYNEHYGINIIPHGESGMEYSNDAANQSFQTYTKDDIKLVDTHLVFKESLLIKDIVDRLESKGDSDVGIDLEAFDEIIVVGNDDLFCEVGSYDRVWDAKQWEQFGYEVPYENWVGLIPLDKLERDNDEAKVTTGITDSLILGFDFLFKDELKVKTDDEKGFEAWGYESWFHEKLNVHTDNQIATSWDHATDNRDAMIHLRKESMSVSYEFEDSIKSHNFVSYDGGNSVQDINIYDKETHQLIESIVKYRFYEQIDASINSDLLTSTLFKYDDELSLITDYKTKIDLYKAEDDGSLTRSMTVIKDKTSAKIELLFNDGVMAVMKDKLHASEALRPDEYLE